jgi:hypothetical protein
MGELHKPAAALVGMGMNEDSPGGHALIAFHTRDAETAVGESRTMTKWWGRRYGVASEDGCQVRTVYRAA